MDDALFHDDSQHLDGDRAFVAAAAAMARLDEAIHLADGGLTLHLPCARRREAAGVAAAEGLPARLEALARLVSDPEWTGGDRGARRGADAYRALLLLEKAGDVPAAAEVAAVFSAADASTGRLGGAEATWTVEEDSSWLSGEIEAFSESADPWTALEAVRKIAVSGRFFGTSRRMAALVSPWIVAKGFGCRGPFYGLASAMAREPEGFRSDARDPERWAARTAAAVARAAASERAKLDDAAALRTTLLALAPPTRRSSSNAPAVEWMFSCPVFSAREFSEAMDLSPRGSKEVLDRLVEAGAVQVSEGSRNRTYACRRIL